MASEINQPAMYQWQQNTQEGSLFGNKYDIPRVEALKNDEKQSYP